MRKIQEYIAKGKQIFVGLEDSKRTWKLCVRSDRMIVHETGMPAEYENLRSYLFRRYPVCDIQVIYEAGFSGFWLHDKLQADGIECIVTPPNRVTMEKVTAVKTDKRDARRLAKNLENNDFTRCHVPDRERREDRQLSRTLEQVQRDITCTKNRIRKFLDYHGLNAGFPPGRWNDSYYSRLAELELSGALRISLDVYLRVLHGLTELKKELIKELKALSEKARYAQSVQIKKSCPGIGILTAIRLTLEWGDMSRFPSGKHIASYTGLTSREYSTGETVRRGRITAQGRNTIRSWLIQCSWIALRKDPVLMQKFQHVWRNSGSKKKAIVAVARKIVVRLRAVELCEYNYSPGVVE